MMKNDGIVKNPGERSINMGKLMLYIASAVLLYLIICVSAPFWDRYWFEAEISTAAVYGTKHDIDEARRMIEEKAADRGIDLEEGELGVSKNQHNTVSVAVTYPDAIAAFGITLKTLEFTIEVIQYETEQIM
jgi:hypothetical protein